MLIIAIAGYLLTIFGISVFCYKRWSWPITLIVLGLIVTITPFIVRYTPHNTKTRTLGWLSIDDQISDFLDEATPTAKRARVMIDKDIAPAAEDAHKILNDFKGQGYVELRIMLPKKGKQNDVPW